MHLEPLRNRAITLSVCAALMVLTSCTSRQIPRIAIPGTVYSVSIQKDSFKQMHYYQILDEGEPVSEWRLLTGYMTETLSNALVERAGDRAIIRWTAHPDQFVELDVVKRTIIAVECSSTMPSPVFRTPCPPSSVEGPLGTCPIAHCQLPALAERLGWPCEASAQQGAAADERQ